MLAHQEYTYLLLLSWSQQNAASARCAGAPVPLIKILGS